MNSNYQKKVTISTVAQELGLSVSTVSYVLSGQTKKQMSPKTVKLVKETAQKLGYVPHQLARNLRAQKSQLASIFFHDMESGWTEIVTRSITRVLDAQNYTSIINLYEHSRGEEVEKINRRKFEAVIKRRDDVSICQPYPLCRSNYSLLINNNISLIFLGDKFEDMTGLENVSSVTWDSKEAAKTAVKYLIDNGRKKISFIGAFHGVVSDKDRFEGYKEALEQAGFDYNYKMAVFAELYTPPTSQQIKSLLEDPSLRPDAIFAINDAVAFVIQQILDNLGVKVPDDIALIGLGDLPWGAHKRLDLTTVKEPLSKIGSVVSEVALDLMQNPSKNPIHIKIKCNELKIRGTV